jgi:hypothetical protein
MDHTGFDLIATACSHNGWLAIEKKYNNGVLTETIDHRFKNRAVQQKK